MNRVGGSDVSRRRKKNYAADEKAYQQRYHTSSKDAPDERSLNTTPGLFISSSVCHHLSHSK